MMNWKFFKLGQVAEIQNGFAFKSNDLGQYGTPVIKIKNLIPPNVVLEGVDFYTGRIDEKLKKFILKKGDFLISMTGSTVNVMSSAVGKMGRYRLDESSLLNQRVGKIYIIDPENADFEYLYHFLNRYEIHYNLALNATGSANQANISPSQIKDIDLFLPPLPEQRAIASILSALDDKIELNLQTNKTLEEMAMTLYKHWFVDFGPFRDGNFVDSELGLIPEGWEVTELRNVTIELRRGISPTYSENEGIRVINQKCIRNHLVDFSLARKNDPIKKNVEGRLLQLGDVLINSTGVGTLGRMAPIIELNEDTIADSHVTVVRANPRIFKINTFARLILSMESIVEAMGEGSTGQTELSRVQLGLLKVLVPPIALQEDLDKSLQDWDSSLNCV